MRKNNYRLFLLVGLVFFLSIGYAVVNSVTLTVSGSAGAGSTDLKVYFNGEKALSNSSKLSVDVLNGSTSATFVASDMELNETVSFLLEVVNNEIDVPAKITITTNGSNDFYTVYSNLSSLVIQPGETKQVGILVNMKKTPITSADSVANFTITLDVVPVEAADLSSFTIDGTSYYAEEDMTWDAWMNSIYNTDNYRSYCVGEDCFVMNADSLLVSKGTSGLLNVDERIISDYSYVISRSPIPV